MRIAPNCYAVTGLYFIPPWAANAGFITGGAKTLIVDTGSNYISARTIYGYAAAAKGDNTLLVLNTEKHLDHVGGNSFFAERGIDICGHPGINRTEQDIAGLFEDFDACTAHAVRRAQREAAVLLRRTTLANPNIKISGETMLDLGGLTVRVLPTPGHTETNLSVYVPATGVLYCGDCIVNGFIPNLEGGGPDAWGAWEKSLDRIVELGPEVVVPGHGDIISGKAMIAAEIKRINDTLQRAIAAGTAPTGL